MPLVIFLALGVGALFLYFNQPGAWTWHKTLPPLKGLAPNPATGGFTLPSGDFAIDLSADSPQTPQIISTLTSESANPAGSITNVVVYPPGTTPPAGWPNSNPTVTGIMVAHITGTAIVPFNLPEPIAGFPYLVWTRGG